MQAKRDPYRFRFPIELRFVDPNIDDMMYCHFSHPLCFQITMMVFKEKELFQCFKVTTPAACSYWIVGFCRFHRFEHPPIFACPGDDDLDEVAVSWLFLFLWSVVFKVLSFPLPFPFFSSFFMLFISFFLCILLSSVGSLLAMVLCLLFNFSKDLSYPKI
jgi:hypothetical protein